MRNAIMYIQVILKYIQVQIFQTSGIENPHHSSEFMKKCLCTNISQ